MAQYSDPNILFQSRPADVGGSLIAGLQARQTYDMNKQAMGESSRAEGERKLQLLATGAANIMAAGGDPAAQSQAFDRFRAIVGRVTGHDVSGLTMEDVAPIVDRVKLVADQQGITLNGLNIEKGKLELQGARDQLQRQQDYYGGGATVAPGYRGSPVTAPADYQPLIQQAAEKYGLDPALLTSVIKQESAFDPRAVSPAGAGGLMQIMPGTAASPGFGMSGISDAARFDPATAIDFGAQYLANIIRQNGGDVRKGLAGYNAGPARAGLDFNRLPAETQNYVTRIMGNYDATRGAGNAIGAGGGVGAPGPANAAPAPAQSVVEAAANDPQAQRLQTAMRRAQAAGATQDANYYQSLLEARLKEIQAASPAPMTPLEDAKLREARANAAIAERNAREGSPQDRKTAQETAAAAEKAKGQMRADYEAAQSTMQTIDEAISRVKDGDWFMTGAGGQVAGMVGGTGATKLENLLDTIRANLAFANLSQMRQNSPTGGALGNVTERELELLSGTVASLNRSQGSDLYPALVKVKQHYQRIMDALAQDAGGASTSGSAASPGASGPSGGGVIRYDAQGNRIP